MLIDCILHRLTSDAQYTVDNLKANYKKNALEKAKDYADTQNMSNTISFRH
jgi:hypothetical protein